MEVNVIARLAGAAGSYTGSGVNHEGEAFTAELTLDQVAGGNAVAATFVATGANGEVFHDEHAIVAPAADGTVAYHPVSNNLPFVLPHALVAGADGDELVFASGDLGSTDGFRETIAIGLAADSVEYTYSWGMPGGDFAERSRVVLRRA